MHRSVIWVVAACVAAGLAGSALGLEPSEVLVVGNAQSEESVDLAKYYAQKRGIPEKNIVLLKTSTQPDVSREDYVSQVRDPLRKVIESRPANEIRCICTVWGMPIRVLPPALTPQQKSAVDAGESVAARAAARLGAAQQLLDTVNVRFPQTGAGPLKPVTRYFDITPNELNKVPPVDESLRHLIPALQSKAREVAMIQQPGKRRIAELQMMALWMEVGGLQGLLDYVTQYKPSGAPDPAAIKKQIEEAKRRLIEVNKLDPTAKNVVTLLEISDVVGGASYIARLAGMLGNTYVPRDSDAAVDSELAQVLWDEYDLTGATPNALHWMAQASIATQPATAPKKPTLMVSRLDGPRSSDGKAIVNASLAAEADGLSGKFYVDSGAKPEGPDDPVRCNTRLVDLAKFVTSHSKFPVVLDEKEPVFAAGSCPDAALYVGWYSPGKYVPAFEWNRGAVAWHISAMEARNLRDPSSSQWCVKMIQSGAAATVGAIGDTLIGAFPAPEEFFPLLMTGKWTLAECYWRTATTTSWRMVLIGDPLYNPFKARPMIDPKDLPAGLPFSLTPTSAPAATQPASASQP